MTIIGKKMTNIISSLKKQCRELSMGLKFGCWLFSKSLESCLGAHRSLFIGLNGRLDHSGFARNKTNFAINYDFLKYNIIIINILYLNIY